MARVQGHCEPRFAKLRDLMQEFIAAGHDVGASLCVNINGEENVVDIWGGYLSPVTGDAKPWEEDTIVNVFSASKQVTALAALMLISRGLLSPEDKVAQHWPEFAANGKSEITVAQVLAHTAGLSGWEEDMTLEDVCDVPSATDKLARQATLSTPGMAMAYHSVTQGHLIGELVRRKTGMPLEQFIAEEICRPLGSVADFQFGCREGDLGRVATMVRPEGLSHPEVLNEQAGGDRNSIVVRTLCNPLLKPEDANTALWRSTVLGASNGHTNARSLVKILSCFSLGGVCAGGGHRLLSAETVKLALTEEAVGKDLVVKGQCKRGLGVYLTGPGSGVEGMLPDGNVAWGSGWGGSIVLMDADRRLTIAFAMNKMYNGVHPSAVAYVKAVYNILGSSQGKI